MGESLQEYIARLEALQDMQRLRVPRRYRDNEGNVIAHVVHIYGVDADGTPHPLVDTSGNFPVDPSASLVAAWTGGTARELTGTFTSNATANGIIDISPATLDEVILQRGYLNWASHASAGEGRIEIQNSAAETEIQYCSLSGTGGNVTFPRGFTSTTTSKLGDSTSTESRLLGSGQILQVRKNTMVSGETFTFRMTYRSLYNAAVVVTPTGGTWA